MYSRVIPAMMKRWAIKNLVNNFREACVLETVPVPVDKIGPNDILIRNRFVGINASDINLPAQRYDPTSIPVECGFEGIGEVVKIGDACKRLTPGQAVGNRNIGTFSEYQVIPEESALVLPEAKGDYMPLLITAPGAAIGLDVIGKMKESDVVMITAAAGGTGQSAVQYAKSRGCHVIGTCSTDEKKEFLRSIGCDRPINYKKENVHDVLRAEYPAGVNVIFENVGGELLKHGFANIAFKGIIVLFGTTSAYEDPNVLMKTQPIMIDLILRCARMEGFMYHSRLDLVPEYIQKLSDLTDQGKFKLITDNGRSAPEGPFKAIEDIPRAIDYLYSGKNVGKIVVEFPE